MAKDAGSNPAWPHFIIMRSDYIVELYWVKIEDGTDINRYGACYIRHATSPLEAISWMIWLRQSWQHNKRKRFRITARLVNDSNRLLALSMPLLVIDNRKRCYSPI